MANFLNLGANKDLGKQACSFMAPGSLNSCNLSGEQPDTEILNFRSFCPS